MESPEIEQLFQQGIAAIRAGDKQKARDLLTKVVEQDQLHEQAWLWLSAAVPDQEEQIVCLQNVLTINPKNEMAQKGLRKLGALPEEPVPQSPPPAPEPVAAPPPSSDKEGWRAKLSEENYHSEATLVKDMHEPPPRDIFDLANAWSSALIFRIEGAYRDHIEYGPAGHILVSIGVAVLLQILGLALLVGIVFTTGRTLTPQLEQGARSANEFSSFVNSLQGLFPPAVRPAISYLVPAGSVSGAPQVTPALVAAFGTLLLVAVVVSILTTFASQLFQAIVTNRVAEWLGGKGGIIPLTQALTIALVPTEIAVLPLWLTLPLLPLGAWFTLVGAVGIYQFLQVATAINASHKLGLFASMGAVILSGVAMNFIGGCFVMVLGMILGAAR